MSKTLETAYKSETRSFVRALVAAGFDLFGKAGGVDDGDGYVRMFRAQEAIIDACTSVDVARLYATAPDGKRVGMLLVYGNDHGELVVDYTMHPALEAVWEAETNKWEGRELPRPDLTPNPERVTSARTANY